MANYTFEKIYAKLEEIEKILSNAGEEEIKNQEKRVIEIRSQMDQLINWWLKVEEKINDLENKYGLELPEESFDGFPDLEEWAEKLGIDNELFDNQLNEEQICDTHLLERKDLFYILEDVEGIWSFRRGLGYFDLSMMKEAADEFRKVVEKEPDFLMGHFYLGMAYSEMEKYEKALREFRLVLSLSENCNLNAVIHNCKGNIYAELGKFNKAMEEFLKALDYDEKFIDIYFNLGATYYNMGRFQESIENFEKTLDYYQEDWELYYYLGKAYGNLGKFQEAIEYMEKAVGVNPGDCVIRLELGVLYELTGQENKARLQYQKVKENN